ncbi:MAG: valine--tRNA ligase [bacterium]|nr:valine--tRNA ligase [Candidatus Sumerlaeota bacterium]
MELSSRYEPQAAEQKWTAEWEKRGYFHADEHSTKPPYTIVIPPPNVTGILHMGHALNNTLQDVLIRWKRMDGYNALWVPGTDHAGIATQNVVERVLLKEKTSRHELGREAFVERVWQWKEKHGSIIINQLKRLGCSCDWQRERFTLDEGLSRAVRTVFKHLYDDGLLYKDNYIINWCPRCLTTLADDEVDYSDKAGHLWHIRYPVECEPGRFAIVATTRPETMLGDTAVAVNPSDERYEEWIGKHVILPLTGRRIPIIVDDFVEKNFGTGMVKITPAHDPNDYQAGKRHGLEEINIFTPDAKVNDVAPAYKGLDRYEARKRVVADLQAQGLIERIDDYAQRAGECYRCHTVIEPRISLQWFVRIRELARPARKAVEDGRARFHPKMREREYFHWLDNVRDWPISRQLWWGHRIPAWYGPNGEIFVTDQPALPDEPRFREQTWTQDPDVLDTWFSSALWPFSTLGWPDKTGDLAAFYPTSTLITGKEIIFFWVARMIMMGLHFMKEVPFRDVYFNPVVADEHGKKMSKSKGNVVDPLTLIEQYGADALRVTLCDYATQDQYISFSPKRCEGYRNFMNKLWNAARFVLGNVSDLEAAGNADCRIGASLEDRWVLSRYARAIETVNRALECFEFDTAVKSIYDFFWKDYCDYYLELAKPRLYGNDAAPGTPVWISRRQAQITLVVVLEGALRLLHPFCPYITEELWTAMRGRKTLAKGLRAEEQTGAMPQLIRQMLSAFELPNIIVAPWNRGPTEPLIDQAAEDDMALLQEVIYTIRNIRGEMKIQPGAAANVLLVTPDNETRGVLEAHPDFFKTLTNIRALEITADASAPAVAASGVARGVTVYVELPQEMRQQEIERMKKEIEQTAANRAKQETKLANDAFTSKAPSKVIEKERDRLRQLADAEQRLKEKLASLQ